MRDLNVRMQVSDLAAGLLVTLREASKATTPEEVAKSAGEAVAIWITSYGFQAERAAALTDLFAEQMKETATKVQTAVLENFIASAGGRN